jgi:hypothetical protein
MLIKESLLYKTLLFIKKIVKPISKNEFFLEKISDC